MVISFLEVCKLDNVYQMKVLGQCNLLLFSNSFAFSIRQAQWKILSLPLNPHLQGGNLNITLRKHMQCMDFLMSLKTGAWLSS